MNTINDGGPAFPGHATYNTGMSLRDWFAGQALSGMQPIVTLDQSNCVDPQHIIHQAAVNAYLYADAMHEAEKVLAGRLHSQDYEEYKKMLRIVCDRDAIKKGPDNRISATADQRAEAFAKVLNIWKDDE